MILGAAGTLALLTALIGAIALGGNSEPHHLAASLGSPSRDLAGVAAKAVAAQTKAEPAPTASKGARIARKAEASKAAPDPAAAIPASTRSAAASPTAAVQAEAPKAEVPKAEVPKAEVPEDNAFSGLPSLPAVDYAVAEDPKPEAAPADFAHDDNPFVDEGDVED